MQVTYSLGQDELRTFYECFLRETMDGKKSMRTVFGLLSFISQWIFLSVALLVWQYAAGIWAVWTYVFLNLILILGIVRSYKKTITVLALQRVKNYGDWFAGERTVNIEKGGIVYNTSYSEGSLQWSRIGPVERIGNFIHIRFRSQTIYIIPRSAFSSSEEADRFYELAKEYASQSSGDKVEESGAVDTTGKQTRKKRFSQTTRGWLLVLGGIGGVLVVLTLGLCLLDQFAGSFPSAVFVEKVWVAGFRDGDPHVGYTSMADGLAGQLTVEDWEKIITQWKQKIGTFESYKFLGIGAVDRWGSGKGHYYSRKAITSEIAGTEGAIYIRSRLGKSNGRYLLAGVEMVSVGVERESYLTKDDAEYLSEKDDQFVPAMPKDRWKDLFKSRANP